MTSVTWCGREVRNPVLRVIVATLVVIGVAILLPIALLAMLLCLAVVMPFHPIVYAFGRRGFVSVAPDGGIAFHVDATSFQLRK